MSKLRVLGVCGGNGVILHPFKENLIANIEPRAIFHTKGDLQWNLNFKGIPLYRKLQDISNVDVVIGAPDCGHSSILSYSRAKKLSNPLDNDSFQMFSASILKYQPGIFLMENLPKLLETVDFTLRKEFRGYKIYKKIASVSDWGNSQVSRVRLILIGVKITGFKVQWPNRKNRITNVGSLLRGLGPKENPDICHVREPDEYKIPLYTEKARNMTVMEARAIWQSKFKKERRWKVPNSKMVNQPGVYRVFNEDTPLTVRKQSRQFDNNGYMLSPRDIARIQGIPDTFKLHYNSEQHLYCINKARATGAKTPPYEMGQWFKELLTKNNML